jgi:hypothetical protein
MDWQKFLMIAARHLEANPCHVPGKRSWCAWTTFARLGEDAGYWTAPLPLESELGQLGTSDGGNWVQPFHYSQIAHLIIPRKFYWEQFEEGFTSGLHFQDLEGLSQKLLDQGITAHRLTDAVLEVKLY